MFQDIEESAESHKHVEETGLYVKNNGVCVSAQYLESDSENGLSNVILVEQFRSQKIGRNA